METENVSKRQQPDQNLHNNSMPPMGLQQREKSSIQRQASADHETLIYTMYWLKFS